MEDGEEVVVLVFSIISLDCFLSDGEYLTSSWIVYFCVAMLFLLTVIFVLAKNANVHLSKLQQPSDLFGLKPRKPLVRKVSTNFFKLFLFIYFRSILK